MIHKLLRLLEESPEDYVSGEQLSQKLGCSRTAVWKHIQTLRRQGYTFDAVPRLGYRLVSKPSRFDVAKFERLLQTRAFGRNLTYVEQTTSTQSIAHELMNAGSGEGTLVIAEQQSQGKGRMGRGWFSPAGKGLWFTLLLEPRISLQTASQLTYLCAIALCRTVKQQLGIHAVIKWPNDVLIDFKKVCGILLESSAEDDRLNYIAAGVGLNVNFEADDFPQELADKVTSLKLAAGRTVDREQLLAGLLLELETLYALFLSKGFEPIRLLWETYSVTVREWLDIRTVRGTVSGKVIGMDVDGALLLELSNGERVRIFSGDVEYAINP